MADWSYELIKSREQKIRSLARKLEMGNSIQSEKIDNKFTVHENSTWNEIEPVSVKKNHVNVFLLQLVAASALFFITLLGIRYPTTAHFIQTAWNEQMPYDKLTTWYEDLVGSRPTLLPVFPQTSSWMSPTKGKVVLPYDEQRKGVVIQTTGAAPVVASSDGMVSFVGTKRGIGTTVILEHPDGKKSWYGFLGQVIPKVGDKVHKGQQIGKVGARGGHYFVYIALQSNGQFIDPNGIIPFR